MSTKHRFLAGFNREQTETLSRLSIEVRFRPGESIFRQGESAKGFFLIETGEVALEYKLSRKKTVQIQKIGPGELLGLSWLFEPYRWEFGATAASTVTASLIAAVDIRAACQRDSKFGYRFMEVVAGVLMERLQATRHKLRVFVERASEDDDARQVC